VTSLLKEIFAAHFSRKEQLCFSKRFQEKAKEADLVISSHSVRGLSLFTIEFKMKKTGIARIT
jgi:hypothetical protein